MSDNIVAQTILAQLGGARFIMMTGARNFVSGDNQLTFHFPMNNNINCAAIKLNPRDFYDVTFYKYSKKTLELKEIKKVKDVDAENLREIFTSATGLLTSLLKCRVL
jgi:hypothetical protein